MPRTPNNERELYDPAGRNAAVELDASEDKFDSPLSRTLPIGRLLSLLIRPFGLGGR